MAGGIDQDVETPGFTDRALHQMTHVLLFCNVCRYGQRLPARTLDRGTNFAQRLCIATGRYDARSALSETQSHGPADARCGSGYQNYLVDSVSFHR